MWSLLLLNSDRITLDFLHSLVSYFSSPYSLSVWSKNKRGRRAQEERELIGSFRLSRTFKDVPLCCPGRRRLCFYFRDENILLFSRNKRRENKPLFLSSSLEWNSSSFFFLVVGEMYWTVKRWLFPALPGNHSIMKSLAPFLTTSMVIKAI